jgi:glutamate dehydrogenase/leucine dehydrogenase
LKLLDVHRPPTVELRIDAGGIDADALGPRMVVHLLDTTAGLDAFVVIDNTDLGVAIGGVRMVPEVDLTTVARLARAMTWKNAIAGIPHGGAKAGIRADPAAPARDKERLIRTFARAMRDLRDYVPGPDLGTDESCMAWVHDEIGRAVALPRVLGGIPLDEIGATGFGLAICAETLAECGKLQLQGARIALHGFGAVGRHAARFLTERGAVLVAVADRGGAVVNQQGLDVAAVTQHKAATGTVKGAPGAKSITSDSFAAVDCDILVPAAIGEFVTGANAHTVRARVVLQGANLPVTVDAEAVLRDRGVLCVPDIVANAGGVICAAIEYRGGTEHMAFDAVADRIRRTTREMASLMDTHGVTPREAAQRIGLERLAEAARYRGRIHTFEQ